MEIVNKEDKMKNTIVTVNDFKKNTGVHITVNHNGKMKGMQSLSTSCLHNKFCQARSKDPNSICSKCYAQRQMNTYKNMNPCLERNAEVLCNRILNMNELPTLNCLYFRLEAFSDLSNETQFINYLNICKKNPSTRFALWTKNCFIVDKVFNNGYKKPKNLNIVVSSSYLNKMDDVSKYNWVDRLFTVYDKEHIKNDDVEINCGGLSCMNCLKCYKKSSKVFYINEKLK